MSSLMNISYKRPTWWRRLQFRRRPLLLRIEVRETVDGYQVGAELVSQVAWKAAAAVQAAQQAVNVARGEIEEKMNEAAMQHAEG